MSQERKSDGHLVGWTDAPNYNDDGSVRSWRVKLRADELKQMMTKYVTSLNEKGEGGNCYVTLFMSAAGKPCCKVWDPNSEGAKEQREKRAAERQQPAPAGKQESLADDLPF